MATVGALPPAIFLMGPTAAGKTALAFKLCDLLPCEIISVDSALVYRGMDIGSAKPSPDELNKYPHRLIDIRDPSDAYSAADFRRDALREMASISAAGKIPLLVGGTMLYYKVLLEGLADMPAGDANIRRDIEERAEKLGWPALHAELVAVDPEVAARLHPNHSQRIQRALEVFYLTGKPMSSWQAEQKTSELPYRVVQMAISPSREILHQRIALRFEQMLQQGFVEEVRTLFARGDLNADLPSIRAVGYQQVWNYLLGKIDEKDMLATGIAATRQLAKRQMTWLRKWEDLHWLHTDERGLLDDQSKNSAFSHLNGQLPEVLAMEYLKQSNILSNLL